MRPTSKGQVTLTISIRRALDIDPDTILDVALENGRIILSPLRSREDAESEWEPVIDFTEFESVGVPAEVILQRLTSWTKSKQRSAS